MPRPFKEGLDYFPLDCSFFHDAKIFAIYRHHGAEAIALYLLILCHCYTERGYYYVWDELSEFGLCNDLPYMDETLLHELLKELFRAKLFDAELWKDYHILTSTRIQRTYLWAIHERAKKARQRGTCITLNGRIWLLSQEETEAKLCAISYDFTPEAIRSVSYSYQ